MSLTQKKIYTYTCDRCKKVISIEDRFGNIEKPNGWKEISIVNEKNDLCDVCMSSYKQWFNLKNN